MFRSTLRLPPPPNPPPVPETRLVYAYDKSLPSLKNQFLPTRFVYKPFEFLHIPSFHPHPTILYLHSPAGLSLIHTKFCSYPVNWNSGTEGEKITRALFFSCDLFFLLRLSFCLPFSFIGILFLITGDHWISDH